MIESWVAVLVVASTLVAWWWLRRSRKQSWRHRMLRTSLPAAMAAELAEAVPVYARLAPVLKARVEGKVGVFLAEKTFTGCKDVVVGDALRWVIAGHACLLLAGRDDDWVYDDLDEILIHPLSWRREETISLGDGLEIREPGSFDGESWMRGPVIFSRGAIRKGTRELDGNNVLFHEFAHQLDAENGAMEGCPVLPKGLEPEWARVMGAGYDELVAKDKAGHSTFLDPYGAEHPCEFYAVAVEAFLEIPEPFKEALPEMYTVLVGAFGFDPISGMPISG